MTAHWLCQEAILGIGGVRFLRATGHRNISRFHMNEGHPLFSHLRFWKRKSAGTILNEGQPSEHRKGAREVCVHDPHACAGCLRSIPPRIWLSGSSARTAFAHFLKPNAAWAER